MIVNHGVASLSTHTFCQDSVLLRHVYSEAHALFLDSHLYPYNLEQKDIE
jgi:hypothetical protein